jgi:perosamine synthetase
MNQISDVLILAGSTLPAALEALDRTAMGFLLVVDAAGRLCGTLTDGDIRRGLLRGASLNVGVEEVMRRTCVSLPIDADDKTINATLSDEIAFVPLLDPDGHPVDYATRGRHRRVPIIEPLLNGNEAAYVQECIDSGWISSQGRFVAQFESMIAAFHGVPYALAVSSGTTALHLALVSLGIGPGDEVIVPDFTFAATASAVVHAGATPVFVDVEPDTWTMSASTVARALTDRTRAIIPVHLYGHPCAMADLLALSRDKGLAVIEDAAEAWGARVDGRLTGTFGDAGCHSFFGNKTLTTGEGGAVLFKDAAVFERARMLRDHGMSRERRYWHLEAGFNYRLTNLQAAVGVAQLERIDAILARKQALSDRYSRGLAELAGVVLPPHASWADPVCWLYTIRLADGAALSRDSLAERLLLNGVETRPVFYPLHSMPAFERFSTHSSFPVTEMIARTGLSLPSSVTLSDADVDAVVERIEAILRVRRMVMDATQ